MFRIGSLAVIALVSMALALAVLYSTDDIGSARAVTLAGLLMLIVLPALTLGAILLERRWRGR